MLSSLLFPPQGEAAASSSASGHLAEHVESRSRLKGHPATGGEERVPEAERRALARPKALRIPRRGWTCRYPVVGCKPLTLGPSEVSEWLFKSNVLQYVRVDLAMEGSGGSEHGWENGFKQLGHLGEEVSVDRVAWERAQKEGSESRAVGVPTRSIPEP